MSLSATTLLSTNPDEPPSTASVEQQIVDAVEQAKRAFALHKHEQAVDFYATALELTTEKHGDDAPQTADLYFAYGKALLENAIAQSGVLGKEQTADQDSEEEDEGDAAASSSKHNHNPVVSFSGDGDANEGETNEEDPAINLFEYASKALEQEEDEDAQGENDENESPDGEEPEDDFNAAWEVLDLARAIYEKQSEAEIGDDLDEVRLNLADTYIALADVSLETEKFDQAITDYEAGLALKHTLLPQSSRQLAEAHYKLSMVLDLTPGRLSDAIMHAEDALACVEARVAELELGIKSDGVTEKNADSNNPPPNGKGKGKGTAARLIREDDVSNMSRSQIEAEIKELAELKQDLALKVEELKTSPNEQVETTAPVLAAQALDKELNGSSSTAGSAPVVNDLTTMVKKKKKAVDPDDAATAAVKRKAEEPVVDDDASSKKPKLD